MEEGGGTEGGRIMDGGTRQVLTMSVPSHTPFRKKSTIINKNTVELSKAVTWD